VSALRRSAAERGRNLRILEAVEQANETQKGVLGAKIRGRFGDDLTGLTFAVWGLAFKPNTDDMRDAPSRVLIAELIGRGAQIRAFDPAAMDEARRVLALDLNGEHRALTFTETANEALDGADALVIVTEWKAFRAPDFSVLATRLTKKAIFDGRNLYEPSAVEEAGLAYFPIGRRQVT
jgi:UDPglucose 6-dehydrogenase